MMVQIGNFNFSFDVENIYSISSSQTIQLRELFEQCVKMHLNTGDSLQLNAQRYVYAMEDKLDQIAADRIIATIHKIRSLIKFKFKNVELAMNTLTQDSAPQDYSLKLLAKYERQLLGIVEIENLINSICK